MPGACRAQPSRGRFLQRTLGIPLPSIYGEARWMGWREQRRSSCHRRLGSRHRLSAQRASKTSCSCRRPVLAEANE